MATEVTPRKAVWKHLSDDQAIAALVGNRIDYDYRKDETELPCIIIADISDVPRRDLSGVAWRETRIQITAMANTKPGAEEIAQAIQAVLEGYSGMMAGALQVINCRVDAASPLYQEETGQYHYHVDVIITYK